MSLPLLIDSLKEKIMATRERGRDFYTQDNEDTLSTLLVRPMLRALGWDYENNPDIAKFGYRIKGSGPRSTKGDKEVDIALLITGKPKILIETKSLRENLPEWERQLQTYCQLTVTPMGVLTNGFDWYLYLNEVETSSGRANFTIAEKVIVDKGELSEIIEKLEKFLHKERISSGEALRFSEQARDEKNLHKAWNKLFADGGESLQKAYRNELRTLLHVDKPRRLPTAIDKRIPQFVREQSEKVLQQRTSNASDDANRKVRIPSATVDSNKPPTAKRTYIRFYLFGEEMKARKWAEIARTFLNEVHRRHPSALGKLMERFPERFMQSDVKPWLSNISAHKVENSGIWVNINLNQSGIRKLCLNVCATLGLPPEGTIRFE